MFAAAFRFTTSVMLVLCVSGIYGQPAAFLRPLLFYSAETGPYIETSVTIIGSTVHKNVVDSKYRNSVVVNLRIFRDSTLVRENRYNLHGPLFTDSAKAPAFIDSHRYPLAQGEYRLEMEVADVTPGSKPLLMQSLINVDLGPGSIQSSFIQPLENYKKATARGPLTKSGYDLVPFNADFYPETSTQLAFYYELYNASQTLGEGSSLVFEYFLSTTKGARLSGYSGFRRAAASAVNPLLATLDISKLGSGDYSLVVNARDAKGEILKTDQYHFSRRNNYLDVQQLTAMSEQQRMASFAGNTSSADTLQMFVECLWPIASDTDKETIVKESVKKEPESMKRFLVDFWQRRAADTANALEMWARYYQEVQVVMANFKCGKQKGYYTDRGRVMLQYGMPSQRTVQNNEVNAYPYEIWIYYRLTDRINGHFFSNRRFVFVNKNLGDDCHTLIHSDMRGEINNPRWQYEASRRNYEGFEDPEKKAPPGTDLNNQFDDIYKDPR